MAKSIRKGSWREYLRGKYSINDKGFKDKMRWEIRQIANRIMADLLLICERASDNDQVLIFKNPETRKTLVIPLITALENTSRRFDRELEQIMGLGGSLLSAEIKFKLPLLLKSASYRQKKHIELLCKWGLSRKYAKQIATGETRKTYPTARTPQPLT